MLQKPGRDPSKPEAYRPICIIDAGSKVIKYLLQKRLSEAIGDDGFAENQFGFRKKRSTLQALERVTYATETAIIRKRYCALITYDVRNAFNTLHWPDLFGELRRREVPRYLRRVLYTYFEGRKIDRFLK